MRSAVDAARAIAQPRMGVRMRAAVDLAADEAPCTLGPSSVATLAASGVAASIGVVAITGHVGEPLALGMVHLR